MSWEEIAKKAQNLRDESLNRVEPPIPEVPKQLPLNIVDIPKRLLSVREAEITETTPETLVASLASGQPTALEVVTAFLRRAGVAQKLTNCITELLPERAVARAKYLDDFFQQHKRPIGPLHGLPVSVKEHIGMKDLGLNAGFVSWWEHKAEDDANVLKILWDAGAVFYARTTEPQTLMQLETLSNLYGETVNPYNRKLTSGGSSGGEGALISLRGSCLGLGSDIGGSVRSPAANCGIYSLHPTSYRVPMDGCAATMLAEEQIIAVIGPMSTSLQGLKLFMRTILAAKPWLVEPSVVPLPWREQHDFLQISRGGKLKVGILWNDNVVRPHPPIFRALTEVADKLRATGKFDVVDWNPYKHDEAWKIIASLYFCDGGREETIAIESSGEPWLPLSEWILKENPYVRRLSVEALWHWTARREAYRRAYAKLWNESGSMGGSNQLDSTGEEIIRLVDVILCPAGPGAAPPLGHSKYWGYTSQWNLLDYPAVVFPVSKVDKQIDVKQERYIPRNWDDHLNYNLYDPELYHGAPVSLQLVARRYEDEKVIQALEYITQQIGLPFAKFD